MSNQAYVKNLDTASKFDSKSLLDDFKIKTGYGEIWTKIRNSHVPDMTLNYL